MTKDPWRAENRPAHAPTRRPELGPVPRVQLVVLGALAVLKAVGLVLVAGAIAAGVAGLMSGELDPSHILMLGTGARCCGRSRPGAPAASPSGSPSR